MKKIYCPYCNLRLFDTTNENKGTIEIKCNRCRRIVKIELKETDIENELVNFMRQLESVAV